MASARSSQCREPDLWIVGLTQNKSKAIDKRSQDSSGRGCRDSILKLDSTNPMPGHNLRCITIPLASYRTPALVNMPISARTRPRADMLIVLFTSRIKLIDVQRRVLLRCGLSNCALRDERWLSGSLGPSHSKQNTYLSGATYHLENCKTIA